MKININLFFIVSLLLVVSHSMKIKVSLTNPDNKIFHTNNNQFRNIKMMIDGNSQYIYPDSLTGDFTIPNFVGGVHIIETISNQYLFPVLHIDKRASGVPKMKWLNPIDRKQIKVVHQPIVMPLQKIRYFEPEGGFSVMAFLSGGNGLFIVMGVMMLICYKGLGKLGEAQMAPPARPQRSN